MHPQSIAEVVADYLRTNAAGITSAWIRRLPTYGDLTLEALRDHIPELIESLATLVLEGTGQREAQAAKADYLRMHATLRREQGYSVHQLLQEFDVLSVLLFEVVDDLIASMPDASAAEVHQVDETLHLELGRIGALATQLYEDAQMLERRRLAERLADFARTLEHEIRDPLNTALMSAELLKRGERAPPEERREHLKRLQDNLGRVDELLTEIRRLTLTEQSLADEKWVPVRQVILSVVDELQAMATRKAVALHIGRLMEGVFVNEPRVRLAARNLVANAIKYSDPRRSDSRVTIRFRRAPDGPYELRIEDNGLGIPEPLRDKVFEPGVRAHPEVGSGTGLGLAIVTELLEQRGGSVNLEPSEEGGCSFVVRLPAPLATSRE